MLFLLLVIAPGFPVSGEDDPAARWVFEGLLNQVDPVLAPELVSGWVLAGSFVLDPFALEEDRDHQLPHGGRYTGGIRGLELTADLYREVRFEGWQRSGLAGFDYVNNDPQQEGRDLLGWFVPVEGALREGDWTLRWLQVWLSDPEGRMLVTVPPPVPPAGFSWSGGWFRLVFSNAEGEEAYAEGALELFAPESELDPGEENQIWEDVVAGLSSRLKERDREVSALRRELDEARSRLDGLRRMVDLLVEERSHLEMDAARLREALESADEESARETIASLQAEKALLEENLQETEARNTDLQERLAAMQRTQAELTGQIEELTLLEEPSPMPAAIEQTAIVQSPSGKARGVLTVFEKPMVIERMVPSPPPVPVENITPLRPGQGDPGPRRRPGPRKFR